jgi:branched-chain amino acid transport system substrate-binding protein
MVLRGGTKKCLGQIAYLGMAAVVLASCGTGQQSGSASATASTGTSRLLAGAAGIAHKVRALPGLPEITLDDGLAIYKSRPATDDRTGVTTGQVLIGAHVGLTGPAAANGNFSRGARAVFDLANQAGGIQGRQIKYTVLDDGFNPSQTVQVVHQLVENDKVFAIFNGLGTAPQAAVFPYLKSMGVPDLFVGAGALWIGYPFSESVFTGYSSVLMDMLVIAEAACQAAPGAKFGVIYQNDSVGYSGLLGVIYAAQKYGCTVGPQVGFDIGTANFASLTAQAVSGGVTQLMVVAFTPQQGGPIIKTLRQDLGSKIPVGIAQGAAQTQTAQIVGSQQFDGTTSDRFTVDSADTSQKITTDINAVAQKRGDVYNDTYIVGVTWAELLLRALELAGPDLTRQGLEQAMENGFDGSWTCATCVAPTTYSPASHWTIEALQPVKWSAAQNKYVKNGKIVSFQGQTEAIIQSNPQLQQYVLNMKA